MSFTLAKSKLPIPILFGVGWWESFWVSAFSLRMLYVVHLSDGYVQMRENVS